MVAPLSPTLPMRRMVIIDSAQPSAPTSTAPIANSRSGATRDGSVMRSTPPKPTATASARRQPTRSPSSGIDNSVRKSGMVKPSADTVASGNCA